MGSQGLGTSSHEQDLCLPWAPQHPGCVPAAPCPGALTSRTMPAVPGSGQPPEAGVLAGLWRENGTLVHTPS